MKFPNIYLFDFADKTQPLEELSELLGEERYEYCRNMKSVKAGLCSAYVFLLLRYALKKEFGIREIPRFTYGEHGKPFLRDSETICFNMSHSDTCVVCAVSGTPVGLDIQEPRAMNMRTAKKFLTTSELEAVSRISDVKRLDEEICRLWCIKESYGKFTGKGFAEGFSSFDADKLINSGKVLCTRHGKYFISLCA